MESEKITMFRTNEDKTEIIEQLPKTVSSQVYDSDNEQFLDETLTAINAHTKDESEKKHIEVVSSVPTNLSDSGILFKVDGSSPDVPSTITVDGLNENVLAVAEKLEQKVWYFPTVASMKNARMLKNGDMVITSGFYSENDGGGAQYEIGSFTAENYFVHELANGRRAKLIIQDNQVNIKQLGGRSQSITGEKYDNRLYVLAYINRLDVEPVRFKLYIPSGIWCFSPTILNKGKGFSIIGDLAFGHRSNSCEGTIINALTNNQEYVWKLGSGLGNNYNHELGPFTFTSAHYNYDTTAKRFRVDLNSVYDVQTALLYVDACHNITWHKLFFMNTLGTCLRLRSSWEHTYEDVIARAVGSFNKPVIHFDNVNPTVEGNISALYFNKIDIENYSGHVMKWEREARFANNKINAIILEQSTHNPASYDSVSRNLTDGTYNDATAVKQAILKIEGQISGCNIQSILINNMAFEYAVKDGVQYIVDRLIDTNGMNGKALNLTIGGVYVAGAYKDWEIVHHSIPNESPIVEGKLSILHFNSNKSTNTATARINVVNYPPIYINRTDNPVDVHVYGYQLAPNMIPIVDLQYVTIPQFNEDGTQISRPIPRGRVYTDTDSITRNQLVLRNYTSRTEEQREKYVFVFMNDKTKKPRVRYRNSASTTVFIEGLVDGVTTVVSKILTNSPTYSWADLLPSTNNFDDATPIKVYSLSPNFLFLDVLKYE